MSKLYATLETSRGKTVSISDNESITATVYEGNKKAYSVIIEWCDIGDIIDNEGNELPESEKTKGAIVTTREWWNETEEKRKRKEKCGLLKGWDVCDNVNCDHPLKDYCEQMKYDEEGNRQH